MNEAKKPTIRAFLRRLLAGGLLAGVALFLGTVFIHDRVLDSGAGRIYTAETAPPRRVAIVLGAHVRRDGSPGYAARLRLDCARELYETGKAKKILVSGNNQKRHNRETDMMRKWLIDHGVTPDDVHCDHAGFRTLDTCARAARVWQFEEEVILVTQRFHLPRTLYLADAWDLAAVGVSADGEEGYSARRRDYVREFLARVCAWFDVNILATQPKYFGSRETI